MRRRPAAASRFPRGQGRAPRRGAGHSPFSIPVPGAFKIYFADTGLLARLSGLEPEAVMRSPEPFRALMDGLAENLVVQSLEPQFEEGLCCRCSAKPRSKADLLAVRKGAVVPIEVNSSANARPTGLRFFMEKCGFGIPLRVRFSRQSLGLDGGLLNIPLCMADEAARLIDLALSAPGALPAARV